MKGKEQQRLSELRHKLYQEKHKGKREVVRKLNQEQAEYLSNFFELIPYLYEIKVWFPPTFSTRQENVPGIVKGLYYNWRHDHKSKVIKKLSQKEIAQCERFNLIVKPYKYKVKLV
ncbi:MAG: hypothetical protein J6K45_00850 [Clostridia bacterium]|nr:hypothetical protein [Clostridia bacterium]MBP3503458.1 hypothetical protein [Clostridia bacterium]